MVFSSPGVPGARPSKSSDASTLTISESLAASICAFEPKFGVAIDSGELEEFSLDVVMVVPAVQPPKSRINIAHKYRCVIWTILVVIASGEGKE